MKFKKKLLLIPLLFSFSLTSCNFMGGQEESLLIESVETELDENGNTVVTITYYNEDQEPLTFTIPKGNTGNGIKSIQDKQSDDGKTTVVTVSFTDEGSQDVVLNIPNGISVVGYRTETNEETGDISLYLQYSDGNESDPIIIPKGEKGDAGTSVVSMVASTDENGNTIITMNMSDGNPLTFTIPKGEKGDTGNGIASITGTTGTGDQEGTYTLTFTYTDGSESNITINLPTTAQWFQGESVPTYVADSKDGDYYFDTQGGTIYRKENGIWVAKVTIPTDNKKTYTVTFHWNQDEVVTRNSQVISSSTYSVSTTIQEGLCFATAGEVVPFASKTGYTFQGWFTTKTPNVTNGVFNDLTPLTSDLALYTYFTQD